jgi:thymidylate synthase
VDALSEQIGRECRGFPTVKCLKDDVWEGDWKGRRSGATVDEMVKELEAFEWSDFKVEGYAPAGKLAMKMAV